MIPRHNQMALGKPRAVRADHTQGYNQCPSLMHAHQAHIMPRGKRPPTQLLFRVWAPTYLFWSGTLWITEESGWGEPWEVSRSIPLCPGSSVLLCQDFQGKASVTLFRHYLLSPPRLRSPFLIANINLSCRNQYPPFVSIEQWTIADDYSQHLWAFSSPIFFSLFFPWCENCKWLQLQTLWINFLCLPLGSWEEMGAPAPDQMNNSYRIWV